MFETLKKFISVGAAVGVLIVGAQDASATIIDNGQFGTNVGSVGGAFGTDVYGQSFIAPADSLLVRFGMWLSGGGPGASLVRIDLWADDGSGGAGAPDETNILVFGTTHQGNLASLTRIDTFTSFLLTPGTRYWVTINGLGDQVSTGAYGSTFDSGANTVPSGSFTFSNNLGATWASGGTNDFGVYVETTRAVPEPGTLAILGLGLAGLGFARRRKAV